MSERKLASDLKILVTAYLPHIESLSAVEALVLSQCAIYVEMDEAIQENVANMQKKEEGHDLG